jgi:biotin carboxylase
MSSQPNVLFISSEHKGDPMIKVAKAAGCRVALLMDIKDKNKPWPFESIDDLYYAPTMTRYQDIINTVSYLAREMQIDHIQALDEFEMELAAFLREHLRLPGWGITQSRRFRDKLVMRQVAEAAGIPNPPFIQIKHYPSLSEYLQKVPAPWMLKPRMEASSIGLRKINQPEELWNALRELGDAQSHYLLERFIPGDIYHADSITVEGKVKFVSVQKYGRPPFEIYHGGGVFTSRTVQRDSAASQAITGWNEKLLKALGMENGVTHAEFIQGADGQFYFLEIAARVGGAFVSDLIEVATGVNLWREWGHLMVANLKGEKYKPPKPSQDYAGLAVTLSHQEYPDTSAYNDPEIVWRGTKPYHASLIVKSSDPARVEGLLEGYARRFAEDFLHVHAPMGLQRTGIAG